MHYPCDIPLKGGSYIHARGFSVHHVFRHITVTAFATLTTSMYISELIWLMPNMVKFYTFLVIALLQEHAAMALQYFTGINTETALHSLLVLSLAFPGFTVFTSH